MLLLVPLSQSLSQLRDEYRQQQRDNTLRRAATELWQQNFALLPNGAPRSFIDQLTVSEQGNKLQVMLRVLSNKTSTSSERAEYTRLLATRLNLAAKAVSLQLIEVPTAQEALLARPREEPKLAPPTTMSDLRARYEQQLTTALQGVNLPPDCHWVGFRATTGSDVPLQIRLFYLSDRDITPDAEALITTDVRTRCDEAATSVVFDRIPPLSPPILFGRNEATVTQTGEDVVRRIRAILVAQPSLHAEIIAQAEIPEGELMAEKRAQAINAIFSEAIASNRISVNSSVGTERIVKIRLEKKLQ